MPLVLLVFHSIHGAQSVPLSPLRLSVSSHLPSLATSTRSLRGPSAPPASRASNKIPICQLGGGRAPDAHLPLHFFLRLTPRPAFLSFSSTSLSTLAPTCISEARNRVALRGCRANSAHPIFLSLSLPRSSRYHRTLSGFAPLHVSETTLAS